MDHFVTVPDEESAEVAETAAQVTYGGGTIPVAARIGATQRTTSLFPKDGGYVVPGKDKVRHAETIEVGDVVTLRLTVDVEDSRPSRRRPARPRLAELLGLGEHRPVTGRQVDVVDLAEAGELAHVGVLLLNELLIASLDTAADDRGRHVVPALVGELLRVAGDVHGVGMAAPGTGPQAVVEVDQRLVVEQRPVGQRHLAVKLGSWSLIASPGASGPLSTDTIRATRWARVGHGVGHRTPAQCPASTTGWSAGWVASTAAITASLLASPMPVRLAWTDAMPGSVSGWRDGAGSSTAGTTSRHADASSQKPGMRMICMPRTLGRPTDSGCLTWTARRSPHHARAMGRSTSSAAPTPAASRCGPSC